MAERSILPRAGNWRRRISCSTTGTPATKSSVPRVTRLSDAVLLNDAEVSNRSQPAANVGEAPSH